MIHLVTCDFVIVNSVRNFLVVSMKKFLFVALGLLALPATASAINLVGGANGPMTFDTVPAVTDFSQLPF